MSATDHEQARPVASRAVLVPGNWLGVLGGGQLGRMFCQAAQSLGYRVAVLDPDPASPAGAVADWYLCAAYDDQEALARFAERCPAITTEFENVPASSLEQLAQHCRVAPAAAAVAIAQDRILEKATLQRLGVAVVPHIVIHSEHDCAQAGEAYFPGILKLARLGYDGKGQIRIRHRSELLQAFHELGGKPCVLEAFVADLRLELSVVVARHLSGEMQCYPPAHNEHRSGILFHSSVPASAADAWPGLQERAVATARRVAEGLAYEGVLCVEFFVDGAGQLLVNEIAPRPHNSGHHTLDACVVSQFEQQVRVLAGLPLGEPHWLAPVAMINVLGDQWFDAQARYREPDWSGVLAIPGVRLHLYGKSEARPGRKMGHINCLGATEEQVRERVARVLRVLGMSWDHPW